VECLLVLPCSCHCLAACGIAVILDYKCIQIKNVVAHCWLDGFQLGGDGSRDGRSAVQMRNKSARDCRVQNLVLG
jgi:hypothetical protein